MLFWQNWLQFLILVLGSLVILVVSVMFLLLFSRCFEVFCVNNFFLHTARLWNSLPTGWFPSTYDPNGHKSGVNFFSWNFMPFSSCSTLFGVNACNKKKKETGVMQATLQRRFFLFFLGVASTHKNLKFTSIKIPSTSSTIGRGIMEFPGRNK